MSPVQSPDERAVKGRDYMKPMVYTIYNTSQKNLWSGWGYSFARVVELAVAAGANLSGADMSHAKLKDVNLTKANLSGAHLQGADLSGANLSGANLTDANLTNANLTKANLWGAELTDANLTGADLSDASLAYAHLSRAIMTDVNLSKAARLADAITYIKDYANTKVSAINKLRLSDYDQGRVDAYHDMSDLCDWLEPSDLCDWLGEGTRAHRDVEQD